MGTLLLGAIAVTLIWKAFHGLFSTFVWGNFSYILVVQPDMISAKLSVHLSGL